MSETKTEKKAVVTSKKGSANTEVVIGSAAQLIKKSVDGLRTAVETVNKLGEQAENYQGLIAQKEARVAELDIEYKEKRRAAEVELEVSIKQDETKVVAAILERQGKIAISQEELVDLRNKSSKGEAEVKAEIQKAVGEVTGRLTKQHESELKLKEAEVKATAAESVAKIQNLEMQVSFLKDQVDSWKNALDAERSASVERSKANAVGSINLGNSGK
jgi:hypothetical protein